MPRTVSFNKISVKLLESLSEQRPVAAAADEKPGARKECTISRTVDGIIQNTSDEVMVQAESGGSKTVSMRGKKATLLFTTKLAHQGTMTDPAEEDRFMQRINEIIKSVRSKGNGIAATYLLCHKLEMGRDEDWFTTASSENQAKINVFLKKYKYVVALNNMINEILKREVSTVVEATRRRVEAAVQSLLMAERSAEELFLELQCIIKSHMSRIDVSFFRDDLRKFVGCDER